jgi:peptidoglycan lytic transglycosylase
MPVPRTSPIDCRNPAALALATLAALLMAACSSAPKKETPAPAAGPSKPSAIAKPGYYKDDGPGEAVPDNIDSIPDAVPRAEALHRFANRPYAVFGREYVPATTLRPYRERGIASWYGRKFHGEKTSTGEVYDMYAMTAAHPTLPIPSYARVTGVASGKSVVVRVNDRGPFLHDRVIDLSYAAAHRIGIAQKGSGEVIVEAILPGAPVLVAAAPLPPVLPPASGSAASGSAASGVATAPLAGVAAPVGTSTLPPTPPAATAPTPVTAATAPPAVVPSTVLVASAAPDPVPVQSAGSGFVVQLGAFASFANAQNFVDHVQNQTRTAQVEPRIRQQQGGLYRVYVGPYADRDEARRAADRLKTAFGFTTTVAPH